MFKRRPEPEDKFFIEIVLCIFRHTGERVVEFGVIRNKDQSYSIPSTSLKKEDTPEDGVNHIMGSFFCEDWESKFSPFSNRLFNCINFDNQSTVSLLYRADLPKVHAIQQKLAWLGVNSLCDSAYDNKFSSEKEKKIALESIYSA
jgi:hypothetical protein